MLALLERDERAAEAADSMNATIEEAADPVAVAVNAVYLEDR